MTGGLMRGCPIFYRFLFFEGGEGRGGIQNPKIRGWIEDGVSGERGNTDLYSTFLASPVIHPCSFASLLSVPLEGVD